MGPPAVRGLGKAVQKADEGPGKADNTEVQGDMQEAVEGRRQPGVQVSTQWIRLKSENLTIRRKIRNSAEWNQPPGERLRANALPEEAHRVAVRYEDEWNRVGAQGDYSEYPGGEVKA